MIDFRLPRIFCASDSFCWAGGFSARAVVQLCSEMGWECWLAEDRLIVLVDPNECCLPFLGLTQPVDVAGPRAVEDSSGALFEREGLLCEVEFFLGLPMTLLELCPFAVGSTASDVLEIRLDSCSKVSMASLREAFDRLTSAR